MKEKGGERRRRWIILAFITKHVWAPRAWYQLTLREVIRMQMGRQKESTRMQICVVGRYRGGMARQHVRSENERENNTREKTVCINLRKYSLHGKQTMRTNYSSCPLMLYCFAFCVPLHAFHYHYCYYYYYYYYYDLEFSSPIPWHRSPPGLPRSWRYLWRR